eukprot:g11372.t1
MVKTDDFETKLFERVVDRLECRYFSMELGSKLEDLPKRDGQVVAYILRAFLQNDEENVSFQSLVNEMPLSHTVQLILRSGRGFPTRGGPVKPAMPAPEPDAKRRWKTMDPVEMEALERERFFKGRWKVLRMPYVEAQVTRMPPGKRLRASLASQLFQVLPNAAPATLAEILEVCFFDERLLTGDLNFDFQEALAKRICSLNRHELLPYILAFCAAMRHCEGPNAYRAWRKKLLPDLLWLLRATKRSEVLENQQFIRPLMRWDPQPGFQHYLAETCARLLISVAGARQVQMDVELLDALAAPLEDLLEKWLKSEEEVPADGAARRSPLSPETMSDVLSVCVTCKVRPKSLPQLMAQLVEQDLGAQPSPERSERWTLPELCVTAHGLALLCENAQVPSTQNDCLVRLFKSRVMRFLGDISMCFLRIHLLLLEFTGYLVKTRHGFHPWWTILSTLFATILLGWLFTRFYEKPIARCLRFSSKSETDQPSKAAAPLVFTHSLRFHDFYVAQTHELRQASAALQLQLMDALLRGASDELLKEETLRNAIDEQLGTWERRAAGVETGWPGHLGWPRPAPGAGPNRQISSDSAGASDSRRYRQISPTEDTTSRRQVSSALGPDSDTKCSDSRRASREHQALLQTIERDYASELRRISRQWVLHRAPPPKKVTHESEEDATHLRTPYVDVAEVPCGPEVMLGAMLAAKCRDLGIQVTKDRQQKFAEFVYANCSGQAFNLPESHLGAEFAKAVAFTLAFCARYTELNLSGNSLVIQPPPTEEETRRSDAPVAGDLAPHGDLAVSLAPPKAPIRPRTPPPSCEELDSDPGHGANQDDRSEVRREQRPRGPGGQGFTQTGAAGGDDEEDPPLPPGHFGASSLGMDGAVQDLWVVEAGLEGLEHGGPPGW